jgi:hypothetical protein
VADDAAVAVLSESGVQAVWPGVNTAAVIGRVQRVSGEPDRTVVGVVSDVRPAHAATSMPSLYLPLGPKEFRRAEFAVRMVPGASPPPSVLRARVREPGVASNAVTVRDVEADLRRSLGDQRFRAVLFPPSASRRCCWQPSGCTP